MFGVRVTFASCAALAAAEIIINEKKIENIFMKFEFPCCSLSKFV